jgi:hypothetical protein
LATKRELECLERVELFLGGKTEVHTGDAVQGLGEMLDDCADREGP